MERVRAIGEKGSEDRSDPEVGAIGEKGSEDRGVQHSMDPHMG